MTETAAVVLAAAAPVRGAAVAKAAAVALAAAVAEAAEVGPDPDLLIQPRLSPLSVVLLPPYIRWALLCLLCEN